MSLTLIESSPGLQIKRDVNFSNLTLNCDPRLIVPDTTDNKTTGILKPSISGKIAVEADICDLDVRNLTVHGKLSSLGIHDIELCNILCDGNFSVSATGNISETAVTGITLTSTGGANDIALSSGKDITLGGVDITSTATGNISSATTSGTNTMSTTTGTNTMSTTTGQLAITTVGNGGDITMSTGRGTMTLTTANNSIMTLNTGGTGQMNLTAGGTSTMTLTTAGGLMELKATGGDLRMSSTGRIQVGASGNRIGFYGASAVTQRPIPGNIAAVIQGLQDLGLFA